MRLSFGVPLKSRTKVLASVCFIAVSTAIAPEVSEARMHSYRACVTIASKHCALPVEVILF